MDNFGVAGRIKEFDRRNGGNPVFLNEWFYYANGATREGEPLGAMIDPPANEYDRLSNIVRYHQGRLVRAVREFDNCKENLIGFGCPDGGGLERLKELQRVVGERNQAVNDAKAQLAQTEQGKQMERHKQLNAEVTQQRIAFRDTVRAIRI